MTYSLRTLTSLAHVQPATWDALAEADNPFTRHAYLRALETSGCVDAPGCGWQSAHLLLYDGEALLAAMPLYAKTDSYGEYIFDWAWAQGSERAGLAYYPKLVSAVPFTPATGNRMLRRPGVSASEVAPVVAQGLRKLMAATGASGVHVLFCAEAEGLALAEQGFVPRLSHQFHWHKLPHWHDFDDVLADMRAPNRKQVRRERARAASHGLAMGMRPAEALSADDWSALYRMYRNTVWEKGAIAYLTRQFFAQLPAQPSGSVWVAMAHRGDTAVAAALYFRAGTSLYGRYWGCTEPLDSLHFELCYYLPIAWGLAHGISHFEAGAQGEHKLKRGLLPRLCHSAHLIAHPGLGQSVRDYCAMEARGVAADVAAYMGHSPFHRPPPSAPAR